MSEVPILTIIATDRGVREVDINCAGTVVDGIQLHAAILPVVKTLNELIRRALGNGTDEPCETKVAIESE
jgi:hypothetical protein